MLISRSIFLCLIICCNFLANATHIVGGDLSYQKLSKNTYRINLALYIDCINGNLGAIESDNKVFFSFFDAKDSSLINYDEIAKTDVKRIEEVNYKCLAIEPNACVERFSYSYIKEIDPGEDGVIIAFQRCCRNKTISNLVDPLDVGATFFTTIPGSKVTGNNSSPQFVKLPPNFLCTNAPLVFNHSATDLDGDSLAYDLIIPFNGANPNQPRPYPASNPPFEQVPMKAPYNVNNFMHGSVLLNIHPTSGVLRVTPSEVGQFVVGIRVTEYRNGVKIGSTFRDYQFNVIDCQFDVVANFEAPDRLCSRDVDFTNKSLGSNLSYHWDFGEELFYDDVSDEQDPSWSYHSEGKYLVSLMVNSSNCSDTFTKLVTLVSKDSVLQTLT